MITRRSKNKRRTLNQVLKESLMEGEKDLSLSKSMAKGLPLPSAANNSSNFQTPSPFSISVASTGWSSRPTINHFSLFLRFLAFLFSFVSALSLVIHAPKKKIKGSSSPSSFGEYSELLYCFTITMVAFAYSVFQLFKGILEIADKGIIMSDMVSDYTSFIVDQLLVYLLVSSSSVAVPAIKNMESSSSLWKASIVSLGFSFATFLVIALSALFSGYKLCKRIIW